MAVSSLLLCAGLAMLAFAGPTSQILEARQSVSTLSASEVSSYKPYTWYAGAAYCPPESTLAWNCGVRCSSNSGFVPIASGGDGAITQHWYVGWDSALQTLIVAYQGTDPQKVIPLVTDVTLVLTPLALRPDLFPGIDPLAFVHAGFKEAHERSASRVLAAVRAGIYRYNATSVTLTGHSLGGAIAVVATAHLSLQLPDISLRTITYGSPRVGNQRFVNFVNARSVMNRVNNKRDVVPTVPLRTMGYRHTEGEIHIVDSNEWKNCPQQDSSAPECTLGYVPSLISSDLDDHNGPYDGVLLGTAGCA